MTVILRIDGDASNVACFYGFVSLGSVLFLWACPRSSKSGLKDQYQPKRNRDGAVWAAKSTCPHQMKDASALSHAIDAGREFGGLEVASLCVSRVTWGQGSAAWQMETK